MVGGSAIYVALRFGYLGVEHTPVAWILAIIGTIVIPAIAVVPLFASLRAVKMVQQKYLRHLGAFLNERLQQADAAIQNTKLDDANKFIGQLENAKKLFEIYKGQRVAVQYQGVDPDRLDQCGADHPDCQATSFAAAGVKLRPYIMVSEFLAIMRLAHRIYTIPR